MSSILIGRKVFIRGNDFLDQDSEALVLKVDDASQTLLLELASPIEMKNITYCYVVASTRLDAHSLDLLISNGVLGCAITWIPEGKYNPSNPMDLSWWRGGAAAITDLYTN